MISISHSQTKYLLYSGAVPCIWYLGAQGHNSVIPLILGILIGLPIIHEQVGIEDEALSYASLTGASVYMMTGVIGYLEQDPLYVLLGLIGGTIGGFWLWATWVYIKRATTLVQHDVLSEDLVGFGVVPVFTGIPLGGLFLGIGAVTGKAWSFLLGVICLCGGIAVLYILLGAEQ